MSCYLARIVGYVSRWLVVQLTVRSCGLLGSRVDPALLPFLPNRRNMPKEIRRPWPAGASGACAVPGLVDSQEVCNWRAGVGGRQIYYWSACRAV